MVRYYSGDIGGKFITDSLDPTYFGAEPVENCVFYGCGCCAEDFSEKSYCVHCYSSYEDQRKKTKIDREYTSDQSQTSDENESHASDESQTSEDSSYESGENNTKLWYVDQDSVSFSFDSSHLSCVTQAVSTLEKKCKKYMKNYKIVDDQKGITYEFDFDADLDLDSEGDSKEMAKEMVKEWRDIARLCLGRQILYCLLKKSCCVFHAEL